MLALIKRDIKIAFLSGQFFNFVFFAALLLFIPHFLVDNISTEIYRTLIFLALIYSSSLLTPLTFQNDYNDGTLEQIIISNTSLELYACSKILTLNILIAPIFCAVAYFFETPLESFLSIFAIASLHCLFASLSVGNSKNALSSFINLPFFIPVAIFFAASNLVFLACLCIIYFFLSVITAGFALGVVYE